MWLSIGIIANECPCITLRVTCCLKSFYLTYLGKYSVCYLRCVYTWGVVRATWPILNFWGPIISRDGWRQSRQILYTHINTSSVIIGMTNYSVMGMVQRVTWPVFWF